MTFNKNKIGKGFRNQKRRAIQNKNPSKIKKPLIKFD